MLLRCWRISQGSGVKLRRMKYELSSMERGMEYKTREQFFIFINYNIFLAVEIHIFPEIAERDLTPQFGTPRASPTASAINLFQK